MLSRIAVALLMATAVSTGSVKGKFVVGGVDANLKHVRVVHQALDGGKGKQGYKILLSEKPSSGDINAWRSDDPKKRGSFMLVQLEPNGAVWVADLAHTHAKTSNFGIMTELRAADFKVANGRLSTHLTTNGEQSFTSDRYSIDLMIDAPIE